MTRAPYDAVPGQAGQGPDLFPVELLRRAGIQLLHDLSDHQIRDGVVDQVTRVLSKFHNLARP